MVERDTCNPRSHEARMRSRWAPAWLHSRSGNAACGKFSDMKRTARVVARVARRSNIRHFDGLCSLPSRQCTNRSAVISAQASPHGPCAAMAQALIATSEGVTAPWGRLVRAWSRHRRKLHRAQRRRWRPRKGRSRPLQSTLLETFDCLPRREETVGRLLPRTREHCRCLVRLWTTWTPLTFRMIGALSMAHIGEAWRSCGARRLSGARLPTRKRRRRRWAPSTGALTDNGRKGPSRTVESRRNIVERTSISIAWRRSRSTEPPTEK